MPGMPSESKQPPIERMANVIAHEIRSPLAVINTSVYFVKTKLGTGADAKVAKHLGMIEIEARICAWGIVRPKSSL